jgi:hypothetical protein
MAIRANNRETGEFRFRWCGSVSQRFEMMDLRVFQSGLAVDLEEVKAAARGFTFQPTVLVG